jgi:nanoRNase/pAp phosphatase (c-di-AMP/oligoRNAs hydrolase)
MPGSPAQVAADTLQSAVSSNPALVVGAAFVAVVVLSAAAGAAWWMRRPPGRRLRRALSKPDAVVVLMHPNPDPDAMASALGVADLAESAGTDATIQYAGQIRHQENRAFHTVLDLDFEPVAERADLAADTVVLVDHNEPRGFTGADGITPYAVVDHHPGDGEGSRFSDVRPDYGASASIVAEYFEELGATPGDDDALPAHVATGLLYGILADTNHLTRGATAADFAASEYLSPGVDESALDRIANPEMDEEVFEIKNRAFEEREVRASFAVCDVGTVSNVDAIPQAADELSHLEGVTAVVVLGDHDDDIHLSGRSRDDRVHMGRALEAAVEGIPMASAGGHARMGGGQVFIPHMGGLGPSEGVTREGLVDRIFESMNGEV